MQINQNNADRFNQTGSFGAGSVRRSLTDTDVEVANTTRQGIQDLVNLDQGKQDLNPAPGAVRYKTGFGGEATETFDATFSKKDGYVDRAHVDVKVGSEPATLDLAQDKDNFTNMVTQYQGGATGYHIGKDAANSYVETWNVADGPQVRP